MKEGTEALENKRFDYGLTTMNFGAWETCAEPASPYIFMMKLSSFSRPWEALS